MRRMPSCGATKRCSLSATAADTHPSRRQCRTACLAAHVIVRGHAHPCGEAGRTELTSQACIVSTVVAAYTPVQGTAFVAGEGIQPAEATLAPTWQVASIASSSSAIRTSHVLTRPSTEPDSKTCASAGSGWNARHVMSSEWPSVYV